LLAAAALVSLGLLQFGWARAVYSAPDVESGIWFDLSLAFAVPTTLSWVLLSRSLGSGPKPSALGIWSYYIGLQALFALAALGFAAVVPSREEIVVAGSPGYPLGVPECAMLLATQLNLILAAASFESTYLALPRTQRQAFLPGLLGTFLASGYFTYVIVTSILTRRVSFSDLSLGALPVIAVSLLLPISLVRGRLGEVRVRRAKRPLTKTTSLTISLAFLVGATTLLSIARATGWSFARSLWVLTAFGASIGIAALAISNRLQRRLQRFADPYVLRRGAELKALRARMNETMSSARSLTELQSSIPRSTREIVGAEPVTLFWIDEERSHYAVVASTLGSIPSMAVLTSDPLAAELRRAGRSIRLRGRPDDLEFIPIYVENAAQIDACGATCAAPIHRDEEMIGFVLCGEPAANPDSKRGILPILNLACRIYSDRLDGIEERRL
jgi:hypothetical protein